MENFHQGGLLRGLADSGGLLRRVPQNQEKGLLYRDKASERGVTDLKPGWLTRSTFPVG